MPSPPRRTLTDAITARESPEVTKTLQVRTHRMTGPTQVRVLELNALDCAAATSVIAADPDVDEFESCQAAVGQRDARRGLRASVSDGYASSALR